MNTCRLPSSKGNARRSFLPFHLLSLLCLVLLSACGSGPAGTDDDDDNGGGGGNSVPEGTLTVLYTVDERGRLSQSPSSDGPAKLMNVWRTQEGFDHNGDFLVLSGGNSWMGEPLSVYFQGGPMVAVMNRMFYDATAIGFQEFIFGPEALRARSAEATYSFLAANLRLKSSGGSPDFATSSIVVDVNGMKVGLVGLAPLTARERNAPKKTEDFDFLPYLDVLDQGISATRSNGADVVVVLTSLCHDEILSLIPTASQAGVAMIGGGYCGQAVATVQSGVAIVVPKPYFSGYGKVTFKVNKGNNTFSNLTAETKNNAGGSMDEEVQNVLDHWGSLLEAELGQVIGYASEPVPNKSVSLYNLVMDSWLFAFPEADIAHLNDGAVRQGIPEGDILKGLFLGMMPFQNELIEVELTGAEVVSCLQPSTIMAGMTSVGGYFHSDGSPLKMDSVYHVLTTDFIYGQAGTSYAQYDGDPVYLGMTYDQPPLLFVESLGTSPEDPLKRHLDPTARR